jgi:hypothetical protein
MFVDEYRKSFTIEATCDFFTSCLGSVLSSREGEAKPCAFPKNDLA